jgi:hypothetical protein
MRQFGELSRNQRIILKTYLKEILILEHMDSIYLAVDTNDWLLLNMVMNISAP